LYQKIYPKKSLRILIVILFFNAFVFPYTVLAGTKKLQRSDILKPESGTSEVLIKGKDFMKNLRFPFATLHGSLSSVSLEKKSMSKNSLFSEQKPPVGKPAVVSKKGINKKLLILLGIVGGGAAAYFLTRGGGDEEKGEIVDIVIEWPE